MKLLLLKEWLLVMGRLCSSQLCQPLWHLPRMAEPRNGRHGHTSVSCAHRFNPPPPYTFSREELVVCLTMRQPAPATAM